MMGLSIVVTSSFRFTKAAAAGEKNKSPAAPQIVRAPSVHGRIHGDAASSRVNMAELGVIHGDAASSRVNATNCPPRCMGFLPLGVQASYPQGYKPHRGIRHLYPSVKPEALRRSAQFSALICAAHFWYNYAHEPF